LNIQQAINLFFTSANDIRVLAFVILIDYGNDHDDAGVQCRKDVLGNILTPRIELRT
jgi:hypothetical protein